MRSTCVKVFGIGRSTFLNYEYIGELEVYNTPSHCSYTSIKQENKNFFTMQKSDKCLTKDR